MLGLKCSSLSTVQSWNERRHDRKKRGRFLFLFCSRGYESCNVCSGSTAPLVASDGSTWGPVTDRGDPDGVFRACLTDVYLCFIKREQYAHALSKPAVGWRLLPIWCILAIRIHSIFIQDSPIDINGI